MELEVCEVGRGGFSRASASQARVDRGGKGAPRRVVILAESLDTVPLLPLRTVPIDLEMSHLMYTVCLPFTLQWCLQLENYSNCGYIQSSEASSTVPLGPGHLGSLAAPPCLPGSFPGCRCWPVPFNCIISNKSISKKYISLKAT